MSLQALGKVLAPACAAEHLRMAEVISYRYGIRRHENSPDPACRLTTFSG
ncbi:hypothetical protein RD1_4127 [Roseobacter denitrificans OCh 114]|uniref:Uncharacterized protein n=1 Tax=Roseobacter denitrificans (strain ATCC 33942 / OCh 114) TaxID=375451 RepID=Q160M6_ROSDO|nr:hypothetical protein RD1_4127 [Roseobacter denitrificans OCh 114]